MIETREWIFRVSCRVEPGEKVYVTGSCEALGSWNAYFLKPLEPDDPYDLYRSDCDIAWNVAINLPHEEVKYRFVVCSTFKKDRNSDEMFHAVRRWETNLQPRVVPENESNVDKAELLMFGYINDFSRVDEGWLGEECLVQLKFYKSTVHNDSVVLWKRKYKDKNYFVKVTPIDLTKKNSDGQQADVPTDESTEVELAEIRMRSKTMWPNMEVSVLKEDFTAFRSQDQFGVNCNEDFIIFQCRMADHHTIAFLMDFYVELIPGENPQYVGCSYMLPSNLKETAGVASLPITSDKHLPIGQVTVHYTVFLPLEDHVCNFEVTYARHWKECWRGIEVGHRGSGNSFHSQTKNCANIRENTIASLKLACENGADMVEFDVQLSKDLVPVIYHDFHACIALKHKKEQDKTDLMEIPIKDLTLQQLQALKVYHKTENGLSRFSDEEFEDHQPFPTLEQAMDGLPDSCGFNIEIKWTMKLKDGTYELEHPFELNRFIDRILKVVLESTTHRKIIFSSFHPDICTMIRLKQNRYPVLFLTCGKCKRWPSYDDHRTSTIRQAVLFASSANILGINVNSEDLLIDSSQIQMAFDYNLVAFCWGDQNSDRETIEFLKNLGLHGIIYDKIYVYNTKSNNKRNVFLCDDQETCKCIPSQMNSGHKEPISSILPQHSPESDKTGTEPPIKRLKTDFQPSEKEGSLTSFKGILSLNPVTS